MSSLKATINFLIKLIFPEVRQITTQELSYYHSDKYSVLIDARSAEEFTISHLQNAVNNTLDIKLLPKDTSIVVYCSIGYRSAIVARQLQNQGFTQVFNLQGGIFQWANEQKPMFQNNQRTQLVHPYNAIWGKLLKNEVNKSK